MTGKKTLTQKIKRKPYILTGIGLVGLLVVVLGPVLSGVRGNLEIKSELNDELRVLKTKRAVLEGIDTSLADDRVERMELVFPSKKPVVALLANLSKLAEGSNLSFSGITLSPGTIGKDNKKPVDKQAEKEGGEVGLRSINFGFTVIGSFDDLKLFMKSLENAAPLMMIESVGLTISASPLSLPEAVQVEADIEVLAFYQAPPEKIGSISSPVAVLTPKEEELLNELFSFKVGRQVLPQSPTGKEELFVHRPVVIEVEELPESPDSELETLEPEDLEE